MGFKEAVMTCCRTKYADFSGRASRSEYWFFLLGYLLMLTGAAAICALLGGATLLWVGFGIGWLALLLPALAAQVRRLHDTNASGWFILLGLIPYAGGLIMLVWYCIPGTKGDNRFGPDPLQGDREQVVEAFS
jgi:uncharacterized membrane protein YhaH (DUF805 family)